ncbi:MAG: RsmD family RNA methyltransferase [Ferruginibacter sp.]
MRIISGKYGGRRISPPARMPYTRPTTDIAREGLFNILQNNFQIEGLKTLDLFGGTGCISYELASRGAADLTIVEKDSQMYDFIKKISESLSIKNMKVVKSDVFRYLNTDKGEYDFIFAGPPYALPTIDELPRIIIKNKLLKPGGWFVLEHTPRNDYKKIETFRTERNYGSTVFSFFVMN